MYHSILVFITILIVFRSNLYTDRVANHTGHTGRLEISQYGLYMVVLYAQTSCDLRHIHIPRIQCLILPGRSGVAETKSSSGSDCHYHSQTNQNDIPIIIIIQSCIIVCHSYCRSNAIITRLLGIGRRDYVHYFPYRTGLW